MRAASPIPAHQSGVYFVRRASGGPIKIGRSDNMYWRLHRLQAELREPIELLLSLPNPKQELALHKRFDHLRIDGEWFAVAPSLLAFIEEQTATQRAA